MHTASEEVTLTVCHIVPFGFCADVKTLLAFYERKTRKRSKKAPQFAKQGMLVSCILETAAPICIERFKDYKMMGRFSLRDEGKTVAIGKCTQLLPREDAPDMSSLKV